MYIVESVDKIKQVLEIKFYSFSTFWNITVGGFVNQLIKNVWPKNNQKAHSKNMVLKQQHVLTCIALYYLSKTHWIPIRICLSVDTVKPF